MTTESHREKPAPIVLVSADGAELTIEIVRQGGPVPDPAPSAAPATDHPAGPPAPGLH